MSASVARRPHASIPPTISRHERRVFSVISVVMALIGWFFADLLYRRKPGMADRLVERIRGVYSLLVNKYWIDQVYNAMIVAPLLFLYPLSVVGRSRSRSHQRRRQPGSGQRTRPRRFGPARAVRKHSFLCRVAGNWRSAPCS